METLIKGKMFSNAIEFYNDITPAKDWKILLLSLSKDQEFKQYFLKFLVGKNDLLSIHLLLSKLFEFSTHTTDDALLDVLHLFSISNNKHGNNTCITNLMICLLVRMSLKSVIKREELNVLIQSKKLSNEDWVDELLEQLEYYKELGLKYETSQNYSKALMFYSKGNNLPKIQELTETLAMIDNHFP